MLDHCDSATAVVAIDLILRATQRRLTTADRLRRSIGQRHRQRWRSLLLEVLTDVVSGVESALELRYLRDVEQPHALPTGTRNEPEKQHRSHSVSRRPLPRLACHRRVGRARGASAD